MLTFTDDEMSLSIISIAIPHSFGTLFSKIITDLSFISLEWHNENVRKTKQKIIFFHSIKL